MSGSVSATEIESGYIKVSSTGEVQGTIGFRPDYIEFISAQQIESVDFRGEDPENFDCPDNVNGWSEGSVVFDESGVEKQFSIGMFRNSDSTNGHITASSTEHVIRNIYTDQDGNECGRLEASVSDVSDIGFTLEVEDKYDAYDEIIRYKAYQFPDNMEFDAGMKKIDSTDTGEVQVEDLGFQPANLHIRSGQQITDRNSVNEFWRAPAGRSKGYATLNREGDVEDQQSIGTASSSDSTNRHRSLASDQHVLNTVYVNQDGNVLGRLEGRISGADQDGFSMDIETNSYGSDEIFLYRAWGFSYYDFDIGYKVISESNYVNWDSDEPNDAGGGEGCAEANWDGNTWNDMDCSGEPHKGLCEYPDGSYNTTESVDWAEARTQCSEWGGHLAIVNDGSENQFIYNNFGNVWIGYYQPDGNSGPSSGWKWVDQKEFRTGFRPDAIDVYAEQQISGINNEVVTGNNEGCDNAGGWSNGFYLSQTGDQWSLSTGRTSASQNTHRYGASDDLALQNLYHGGSGFRGKCGYLDGEVTSVDSDGFNMDFDFNSKFVENFGEEMVYYRAFNFLIVPPQIEKIEFNNSTSGHKFGVRALVNEGSNDINSCEVIGESQSGVQEAYSGSINKINDTWSECTYYSVNYDDRTEWKDRHEDAELPELDITIRVSDIDGQSSERTKSNQFPNNEPLFREISFSDYQNEHAFNVTAEINYTDNGQSEMENCFLNLSYEGETKNVSDQVKMEYKSENLATCSYENVSRYTFDEADPEDSVKVDYRVFDLHGSSNSTETTHEIPNRPPSILSHTPQNDGITSRYPINLSLKSRDADDDNLFVYFLENGELLYKESTTDLDLVQYDWGAPRAQSRFDTTFKVGDNWTNTSEEVNFLKIIGRGFTADTAFDNRYSSVILSRESTETILYEIENTRSFERRVNISLSGVNSEFESSQKSFKNVDLGPYESKEYIIIIKPTEEGQKRLETTANYPDIQYNETESIPVLVREVKSVSDARNVPGMNLFQILFIVLVSSYLYSVRL